MARYISAGDFSEELQNALETYGENIDKGVEKSVRRAAVACNKEIKSRLYRGHGILTGDYRKSFRIKHESSKSMRNRNNKATWYVANGEHRLTHLLEEKHNTRHGQIARAVPHVKYGEEIAREVMMEGCEDAVRKAAEALWT